MLKYLSVDLETTGLNPETDLIVEMAAVTRDKKHVFHALVYHPKWTFSSLWSVKNLDWSLYTEEKKVAEEGYLLKDGIYHTQPEYLKELFLKWLKKIKYGNKVVAAGKNFGSFDALFLKKLGITCFDHRTLDPSIFYLEKTDFYLPGTEQCKDRAKIKSQSHRALQDALDIIDLLEPKLKILLK